MNNVKKLAEALLGVAFSMPDSVPVGGVRSRGIKLPHKVYRKRKQKLKNVKRARAINRN